MFPDMPYEASWLRAPDYLGASEAGARLGLSRQQMLEQADQHAAELALRADELRAENSRASSQRMQEQNNFNAGLDLRRAALKQQGLLGGERLQDEESRTSAISGLDQARTDALNRKGLSDSVNSRVRQTSLQNLPELMAAHPEMTKAEIFASFPMLKPGDIPNPVKPAVKPVKPLFPQGVQDQLFKQLLANSRGGTNVDDAVSGLKRYMTPPDESAQQQPEPAAAESLAAPTAESVEGLDNLNPSAPQSSGVTVKENATGKTFIYKGDPNDIPTNRYEIVR